MKLDTLSCRRAKTIGMMVLRGHAKTRIIQTTDFTLEAYDGQRTQGRAAGIARSCSPLTLFRSPMSALCGCLSSGARGGSPNRLPTKTRPACAPSLSRPRSRYSSKTQRRYILTGRARYPPCVRRTPTLVPRVEKECQHIYRRLSRKSSIIAKQQAASHSLVSS